ncbi:MAG: hypothetical protein JWN00_1071 [Actinomycetia bacterium]|nr:hypothetical protein [Actinomycetes bacterium]
MSGLATAVARRRSPECSPSPTRGRSRTRATSFATASCSPCSTSSESGLAKRSVCVVDVGHHDPGAVGGEAVRRGPADATARTGDDNKPAVEGAELLGLDSAFRHRVDELGDPSTEPSGPAVLDPLAGGHCADPCRVGEPGMGVRQFRAEVPIPGADHNLHRYGNSRRLGRPTWPEHVDHVLLEGLRRMTVPRSDALAAQSGRERRRRCTPDGQFRQLRQLDKSVRPAQPRSAPLSARPALRTGG